MLATGVKGQITLGNLTIDGNAYHAWVGSRPVELTFSEYELLLELARHAGKVLSRQELLRKLWPDTPVDRSRNVDVHVTRLRKKLTGSDPWIIKTVKRRGYMLFSQDPRAQHTGEII